MWTICTFLHNLYVVIPESIDVLRTSNIHLMKPLHIKFHRALLCPCKLLFPHQRHLIPVLQFQGKRLNYYSSITGPLTVILPTKLSNLLPPKLPKVNVYKIFFFGFNIASFISFKHIIRHFYVCYYILLWNCMSTVTYLDQF